MAVTRYGALVLLAAIVTGCGTNTIRIERAGTVASAGSAAVEQTRQFFERTEVAREDANIVLVASDDSCAWGKTLVLRGDRRPLPARANRAPLCLAPGETYDSRRGDLILDLQPISAEALRPTIETIDALASYLDAVNAILDDNRPDVAAQLSDALGKATAAQADVAALTGANIPQLKDGQIKAITDLLGLISTLASEQAKVNRLRALVREQNPKVQALIAMLKQGVGAWANDSLTGDLQLTDASFTALGRDLGAQPPRFRDFETRRAIVKQLVAAKRMTKAIPALRAALTDGLDQVAVAQTALADAMTNHPHWTATERHEAARVNRERLLAALHSIAAVASAF